MPSSILVPHDGSSHAQTALEYALETFPAATIVLFHAIDPFELTPTAEDTLPPLTEQWLEERHAAAEELFAEALEDADVDPETHSGTIETDTAVGSPPRTIVAYTEDTDIDGIVIGGRGQSSTAAIQLGSATELVVKRASVPVTVVR